MPPADALQPIPLTIVTGFLGAGKTTLINALLREPLLADTVVLVNEFGEVGLDHDLIEAAEEDMVLLAAGCLCCTIRGDLIKALEDLLRRRDNGRIRPFRRVLIETTGLADPAPILHLAIQHPYLARRFALQGLVTVVDAANGEATLDAHPEAVKQVAVADRLVLSKSASAEPARIGALRDRLKSLNPTALIVPAEAARAADLLDCGLYSPAGKTPDVLRWLDAEAHAHDHDHTHDHHHDHAHHHHGHDHGHGKEGGHAGAHQHAHDRNRHDARIRAFTFTSDAPLNEAGLTLFREALRLIHGSDLLRMKGIVRLAERPERPVVLHAVQHVHADPVELERWPGEDRRSRLVVIARDIGPETIAGLWHALAAGAR